MQVDVLIIELAGDVIHVADEPLDQIGVTVVPRILPDILNDFLAELFFGQTAMRYSKDSEFARE